jgi:glycosyltransferase involved in cell wall biosynthesis
LSAYDVIVSSNHAVAKGVLVSPDQLHISYVHTPIRYAWDLQHQYLRQSGLAGGVRGLMARLVLHYMRSWDQAAANRVDLFVANSHYIARRIEKCYRRRARVIYPPVDIDRFTLSTRKENFYVTAARMVPYKRIDIIVEAFSKMPNRKLVVIGDGPEATRIKALAGPNVQLLGHQPPDVLQNYLQRAKAFVFAAEEDFGITIVEAQASGTAVIAFGRGGATETVIEGETGLFFDEQTPQSVMGAVHRFEQASAGFDPLRARAQAERFSVDRFRNQFARVVDQAWERFVRRNSRPAERKGYKRSSKRIPR